MLSKKLFLKIFSFVFVWSICIGFFLKDVVSQTKKGNIVATVKFVYGKAFVLPLGEKIIKQVTKGMFISEGDLIETKSNSFAILLMLNGSEIKINQKTKFNVEFPERGEKSGSKVKISVGQIWLRVIKGIRMNVQTPTAVASVRGTELDVKVQSNGQTEILVYDGIVNITNEYGTIELKQEQKTVVPSKSAPIEVVQVDITKVTKWQDKVEEKFVEETKKEEIKKEEVKKEEAKEEKEPEEKKEEVKEEAPPAVKPEPSLPPVKEASPSQP